ncbi:MAG: hypothetical protein BroJett011_47050 [Chloroflexota bacterium]|nr:MAG: hypothetical protein BroJett011_47050 [Chloroflexota bacterium]
MDHKQHHPRSHLFTVRLWAENIGHGQTEWRGRVQHVPSGEAYYFRDWPTLVAHLLKMLPQAETQSEAARASKPNEGDDDDGTDNN